MCSQSHIWRATGNWPDRSALNGLAHYFALGASGILKDRSEGANDIASACVFRRNDAVCFDGEPCGLQAGQDALAQSRIVLSGEKQVREAGDG